MPNKLTAGKRGAYTSITKALTRGGDFRQLPPNAKLAFFYLKMNTSGMAGVETLSPDALTSELAYQMKLAPIAVAEALKILEEKGWLRREDEIWWVVGHITHDPFATPNDGNKRLGVLHHLAGFPHRKIIREFILSHPDWCRPDECKAHGLGWAFNGDNGEASVASQETPEGGLGSTVTLTVTKTDTGYSPEFEELWAAYPKRGGENNKKVAHQKYSARIKEGVAHSEMLSGVNRYRLYCDATNTTGTNFVKMTEVFLGPKESWKSPHEVPRTAKRTMSREEQLRKRGITSNG